MKEIFQETSQFIYSLAAKRIYSKKEYEVNILQISGLC